MPAMRPEYLNSSNEDEKVVHLRIPGYTTPKQTILILSNALQKLGVDLRTNDLGQLYDHNGDVEIIIRNLKRNDLFFYRHELAIEIESKIRKDIENEKKERSKLDKKKTGDDLTALIMETAAEVRELKDKHKKIDSLDAEPTYEEKVEWFCKKYNENYKIMIDSLRDDNLDKLFWDGEKVEFPKRRRDL